MELNCPPYMGLAGHARAPLRYIWDDTRASKDFRWDAGWVLDAASLISTRAQMVLCVGLYEWVMWRFAPLHDDPAPMQLAEAAWCATVDSRYIDFFELSRHEWIGPVFGPLWCAITWLRPAVAVGDDYPGEIGDALQYLSRLAFHVLPEPVRFERWLHATLTRLTVLFPFVPDDPFDDLFNEDVRRRRGPLISRDVLDSSTPYDPVKGIEWSNALLAQADPDANPFLVPMAR